jgi:hypothetical protein
LQRRERRCRDEVEQHEPAAMALVEDLFDVVGWPYDGVDHVVLDDVHETMLDPANSDHPLATLG